MQSYLSVIKRHVEIHATVFLENGRSSVVPDYVINHGIMSGPDLHKLLRESKVCINYSCLLIIFIQLFYLKLN